MNCRTWLTVIVMGLLFAFRPSRDCKATSAGASETSSGDDG
jgi:hypothetical protein